MFVKSTRFKQVCQLLLSLIVGTSWEAYVTELPKMPWTSIDLAQYVT